MTGELYIYERYGHYQLSKTIDNKGKIYGYFDTLEEAIFARQLCQKHDWNMEEIKKLGNVIKYNDEYMVMAFYKNQIRFLEKFKTLSGAEGNAERIIDEFLKNPYKGKYGIYIYRIEDTFYIRKSIKGEEIFFGLYSNLDDATFARDLLMKYEWNLNNMENDGPVFYSKIHDDYIVTAIINDKVVTVKHYPGEDEALSNAEADIESYGKSKYRTGEKNVVYNGKSFAIHYYAPGKKIRYLGSFSEKTDAISVRDILIEHDWDLSRIDENRIYEANGFFLKLHIFEGTVKVIGKYESHDDAVNDENNLSTVTLDSLYDPENPYSKINRNIWKRGSKYYVRRVIDGEAHFIGSYDSRQDAIDARDEFEANGWKLFRDEDSIFSDDESEDFFADTVSNLSMWQKIIYDTIDRLGKKEFSFEELVNHSSLKRYKAGKNFETKAGEHLNELIELGLVSGSGDGSYIRMF